MNTIEALKTAMSSSDMTQAKLAKALGLKSQTGISERLRSKSIGSENLIRMFNACGFTLQALNPTTGEILTLTPLTPMETPLPASIQEESPAPGQTSPRKKTSRKTKPSTSTQTNTPASTTNPTPEVDLDALLGGDT